MNSCDLQKNASFTQKGFYRKATTHCRGAIHSFKFLLIKEQNLWQSSSDNTVHIVQIQMAIFPLAVLYARSCG